MRLPSYDHPHSISKRNIVPRIIVITATDTAIGKTVLTSLLARHLTAAGQSVIALKPLCSGGRDDARELWAASGRSLSLNEINPWHFRAPLAPVVAARKENRTVHLNDVVAHVRNVAHRYHVVLVEGAGGILSPLGEHFCTREIISALGADVIIAARNQLGVVNHVRLTVEALPVLLRPRARIALISPPRADLSARTNAALLGEFVGPQQIVTLPWLRRPEKLDEESKAKPVKTALASLLH